jgi:inorganic triphosphatase YgiF
MDPGTPREIELKLLVSEADVPRLRRHPRLHELGRSRPVTRTLESVYWDTPELDLHHAGVALRVRRAGGRFIQTLKTRGEARAGLFDRGEWEAPVGDAHPDLEAVSDPGIRDHLGQLIADRPLEPVVTTVVRRTRRLLGEAGWQVLCEIDVGEVRVRGRSARICELELELLEGEPVALYDLALVLSESVALRPAVRDKAEQGFDLLLGRGSVPQRARPPRIAPDASLDDAMVAIFASGLEQVLGNEEPSRTGVDPEGVHQMRVGARRLRSAFSVFRESVPREHAEPLKEGLRWLGSQLGDARDIDVFLEETLAGLRSHYPDDPDLKRLREVASELRDQAYDRVLEALASQRYAALVLGLSAWINARGWRDQPLTPSSARLFAPARVHADRSLRRRQRKARRLGRDLAQRTPAEKHALRIELKKLRYAAEFFRSLYPEARSDRTLKRLARLQDVLGHLNDQAAADRLLARILERLGSEGTPAHHRAAGLVSGWTARGAEDALARLGRRWRRYRRTRPFWAPA